MDARATLLDALRDHLRLTGANTGCDLGQRGACTVLLDRERIVACLALVARLHQREVTTIEGLATHDARHPLQAAFLEAGHVDERDGRVTNASRADYLVPVHADVPSGEGLEVIFVGSADPHANPLGVKGFGELAMSGTAPALVNAVFRATGRRVRELPITRDKLL